MVRHQGPVSCTPPAAWKLCLILLLLLFKAARVQQGQLNASGTGRARPSDSHTW
jgi:hypothetical protein